MERERSKMTLTDLDSSTWFVSHPILQVARQAALDHERRAADLDPDLTTAIRNELTKADLRKSLLDLK